MVDSNEEASPGVKSQIMSKSASLKRNPSTIQEKKDE
jgi:hypothetical protein